MLVVVSVEEVFSAGDYEVDDYLIIIRILGGKYSLTVRSGTRSVIGQVHRVLIRPERRSRETVQRLGIQRGDSPLRRSRLDEVYILKNNKKL